MVQTEIAVIGGGASGLAAAIEAARILPGGVMLLERLSRVGKKLLATGNGRCNLGNRNARAEAYTGGRVLVRQVLSMHGDTVAFFEGMGLYVRADAEGRCYPYSNAAASVLDALRLEAARLGVMERCGFEVVALMPGEGGCVLRSSEGERIFARKVIFAAGGRAAPVMGTDGSAMKLLRGVEIVRQRPALGPLTCTDRELRSLKGQRVQAQVTAWKKEEQLGQSRGEVQFNDGVLSGICVFDLEALEPERVSLDLLPEHSYYKTLDLLQELARVRETCPLEDWLTGLFPKRVGLCLLKRATDRLLTDPAGALTLPELERLARTIKDWDFSVTPSGWERAQATAGGVDCGELTEQLELKKWPGVYVTGEAVDVLGPCGGYNLQWAWASGRCAGCAAARAAEKEMG